MNGKSSMNVAKRYARAQAMELEGFAESMVLNDRILPHWIADTDRFWFIAKERGGDESAQIKKEFRVVNASSGQVTTAFDHEKLAAALSIVTSKTVPPSNLPICLHEINHDTQAITFTAFGKRWTYDSVEDSCSEIASRPSHWLVSPCGEMAAFIRKHNIWVRNLENGEERPLTTDGALHHAYGVTPERTNLNSGFAIKSDEPAVQPEAIWSPDSKKLLTVKVDERNVLPIPITEYVPQEGSVRPVSADVKYALPGDNNIATYRIVSLCLSTRQATFAEHTDIPDTVLWAGPVTGNRIWWASDSLTAYFIDMSRGQKKASVLSFDTDSGETSVKFDETSETYIDLSLEFERPAYLKPLPETNELIWLSERTGWAHIYLYDLGSGELIRPLTKGPWVVRDVLFVDTKRREVFVSISGRTRDRDPYYREVCRVDLDTGAMTVLATGDHDCLVHLPTHLLVVVEGLIGSSPGGASGVSPTGNYFVVTRTRVDEVPVTEVLDRTGSFVCKVADVDTAGLPKGWRWPEPVQLLGADGKTDIYGVIFRPTDFSPEKSYPVLNWAFTNPFYSFAPKGAFRNNFAGAYNYTSAMAFAELGFIVVIFDGRGSCHRSKAFHDEAYGAVHTGSSLADQVAAIKQLSDQFDYMDIDRVGIVDIGGSNAPIYGMLAFPDFYKVGAAISVWDVRLLTQGETYQGLVNEKEYQPAVLGDMAHRLKGKLLLLHGLKDQYFQTAGVMQLLDAFDNADRDVDLMLFPNAGHTGEGSVSWLRRIWDYLTLHLNDDAPPANVKVVSGVGYITQKLESQNN